MPIITIYIPDPAGLYCSACRRPAEDCTDAANHVVWWMTWEQKERNERIEAGEAAYDARE